VDIQPLDVAAALKILIAEVRAELPLPGDSAPAGVALGMELTNVGPQATTPPAAQATELVAPEFVQADLVEADLAEAQLVAAQMPGAVQTPAQPASDVALGALPPTEPAGLVLLESPAQEPLPDAPDLAAVLLGSAGPVGAETPPPLPGGELPRVELAVLPPGVDLGPLEPLFTPSGIRLSSPAQASPVLMRLFLQAVPEEAGNPEKWLATVTQLEITLQSALDQGVATVEQWRNVPQVVVDAARETRSVVMSQLSDEPPGPLWLRPEWMWLTPRMERFRRRRRLARRGLTDPDLRALPEDDMRPEERARRHDPS
jgi:hypothetical protein